MPLGTLQDQLEELEYPLSSRAVQDLEAVRNNPSEMAIKQGDQLSLCIRSVGHRCLGGR